MAQLPHTIGCPLAEAPQAEPASEWSYGPCNGDARFECAWTQFGDDPKSWKHWPSIDAAKAYVDKQREAASTAEPDTETPT